jgi:6-pyruvoyl-tetrahydropterin synthase related domain
MDSELIESRRPAARASIVATSGARSWRAPLLLVILAASAVVTPMCFLGNASGHDFQFHLASWMDAAGQWREGIVYPRWAEWANWGFGEPRFIFYPPASWMIGAALGSILPWMIAPGAFIWLALIAAGMTMWNLAREWLPGPRAGAAALLFTVNPYHLVIVYYRSDFAELLAGALLPLMLWAALDVSRGRWRRVPLLAVVFSATWLSNAPAAVIATYSLVLVLIVACLVGRGLGPLLPGGTAMIAGFGLAAIYILPAAWEQRWVQITQALAANLYPAQNFLFTHSNDPEFLLFNWKVSGVALGVMLTTGIAAVFFARRRREFSEIWWMLAALGAVSVLLMFHPSLLLWRYLPRLRFVQFPWRWLEPLDVVFAFFVAAATNLSRKRGASWLMLGIVVLAIGATGTLIVKDAWWDSDDVPFLETAIRSGRGYDGTDEYAPVGCDRYQLPGYVSDTERRQPPPTPPVAKLDPASGEIVRAQGVRLRVERWSAEEKVFAEQSTEPPTLALRLLNYPAWEGWVDGQRTRSDSESTTAELLLPLAPGVHRIEVRFNRTWDRTAGTVISALSVIAVATLAWLLGRRRPRALPERRSEIPDREATRVAGA